MAPWPRGPMDSWTRAGILFPPPLPVGQAPWPRGPRGPVAPWPCGLVDPSECTAPPPFGSSWPLGPMDPVDPWPRGPSGPVAPFTIIHHYSPYSPLFTIMHHYSSLFTIIHHIHHCSQLFTIIRHYSPYSQLFTIIHQYSPLFTIFRPPEDAPLPGGKGLEASSGRRKIAPCPHQNIEN